MENRDIQTQSPSDALKTADYIPAYLAHKAFHRVRRGKTRAHRRKGFPLEVVLDELGRVCAENSFPVFCCTFVDVFGKLEKQELKRNANLGQSSFGYSIGQVFFDASCCLLGRYGVWEKQQDWLQIRLAERCAQFLLERYAFQKVMHVFREEFGPDEMTLPHLEEARRRKLPALSKILADFAETSASPERNNPQQIISKADVRL